MKRNKSLSVTKRNTVILNNIKDLKANHPFWGYRRCWAYLYYRQDMQVNKKRIYRLMKENSLLVSKKSRNRAKRTVFMLCADQARGARGICCSEPRTTSSVIG